MKMKAGNLFYFPIYFQDRKAVKIFKNPKKDVWFKIVSAVVCLSSRSQDLLHLNECPVL